MVIASERFWSRVEKTDGCWLWRGARQGSGYGRLSVPGTRRLAYAHRMSWLLTRGDPGELHVLHACDNPPCVRPDHLFLGTERDNAIDKFRKGRGRPGRMPGHLNPSARLTPGDVAAIRSAKGRGARLLAAEFGVSTQTIYRILTARAWA